MTRTQGLGLVAGLGLAVVAFSAGEYSTADWWKVRQRLAGERQAVSDLRRELDSLARRARAIETDPATQERVAREEFGMIRDGELLYRIVPPPPPAPRP